MPPVRNQLREAMDVGSEHASSQFDAIMLLTGLSQNQVLAPGSAWTEANEPAFSGFVVGEGSKDIQGQLDEIREIAMRTEHTVNALMVAPQPLIVPISTLAPEPFEIIQPIFAVVEPVVPDDPDEDCEYIASFVEANIATSGDTVEEAVRFLKQRLIDKLNLLESLPKLGELLQRQLDVLQSVIRKCPEEAETK